MNHLDIITIIDNYTCAFSGKVVIDSSTIWSVADEKRSQLEVIEIELKNQLNDLETILREEQ